MGGAGLRGVPTRAGDSSGNDVSLRSSAFLATSKNLDLLLSENVAAIKQGETEQTGRQASKNARAHTTTPVRFDRPAIFSSLRLDADRTSRFPRSYRPHSPQMLAENRLRSQIRSSRSRRGRTASVLCHFDVMVFAISTTCVRYSSNGSTRRSSERSPELS